MIRLCLLAAIIMGMGAVTDAQSTDWPAPIAGHVAPAADEHPRLFFRKADVPELRRRAETPEGRQIIARCKKLLGIEGNPPTPYTLWHGAAAGFLYQVTGDASYADLARGYVQQALDGAIDRDKRYAFRKPSEPLRAGPSISAIAIAYDLCFDAWPADFRTAVQQALLNYNEPTRKGGTASLDRMATGAYNPNPISNHYALQVGGAGLTILALWGDTGVDQARLVRLQQGVEKQARKILTEDFGEAGYFGEHAGPGVIASTWTFVPWLQAERVAAGRDWISSRPNAEWISLRFVMQIVPTAQTPMYVNPTAGRGGYGGDQLLRDGGHHSTYFSNGFGAIQPKHRPAMLWVYQNFVEPIENKEYPDALAPGERSFDIFLYPHRAMFALVNWPFDEEPVNPDELLPKIAVDQRMGQFVFRNRWKDKDDTVVAVLFGSRTTDRNVRRLMVWGLGEQLTLGNIAPSIQGNSKVSTAKIDSFHGATDGSGVVSAGGNTIAVDYSGKAGCQAVVLLVGPGAANVKAASGPKSRITPIQLDGKPMAILTLSESGQHPEPKAAGNVLTLGGQTFTAIDGSIQITHIASPLK